MPRGAKRAAESGAAEKKPKVGRNPNFVGVAAGIRMHDGLPEGVKEMLIACIANGLGVAADVRAEAQHAAVRMIGEALSEVKAGLRTAADAEAAKMREVEGSRGDLDAAVSASEARIVEADEQIKAKTRALAEAAEAVAAAKTALQELENDVPKEGNEAKLLEVLEQAMSAHLGALLAGEGDGAEHHSALVAALGESAMDPTLATAVANICTKLGEERSTFDKAALEEFQKHFKDRAATLKAAIDAAEPAARAREAALEAAKTSAVEAAAAQGARAEDLTAARRVREEAGAALAAATEAVKAHGQAVQAASEAQAKAEAAHEEFAVYNMGCYEILRDARSTQPKVAAGEPEPPAQPTEVAAAGAGA